MTIYWHKGKDTKVKVVFVGDGNNVATSLMTVCTKVGLDFTIASPVGYEISTDEKNYALSVAEETGAKLKFLNSPTEAVQSADVVCADVFVSMGEGGEREEKLKVFQNYQVTKQLMQHAKPDAIFMHCLPAHRGEEVSATLIDSPQSVVFDQAECKMHTAKAILSEYLN